jgi:hypothetical protein
MGAIMAGNDLQQHYNAIRKEAEFLAGSPHDSARRAIVLSHLYQDSGGSHLFPLIAAHGALWAYSYFEVGGLLGRLIAKRYFYDPKERAFRLSLLNQFAEAFREVNRQVCVDTYTNYLFSRQFGHHPEAEQYLHPTLLAALNRVHDARPEPQSLSPKDQREIFEQCFCLEQEITVAPGVEAAVNRFDCRIMRFISLRPLVRFTYFRPGQTLMFKNFASKEERIEKGYSAFRWAQEVGAARVFSTLPDYGLLPPYFPESPTRCFQEILAGYQT